MKTAHHSQGGFILIVVLLAALGIAVLLVIVIRSVVFAAITNAPAFKSGPLGFLYPRFFSQAQSTAEATISSIDFVSPQANQSVKGLIGVAAKISVQGDLPKARALLQIDGKNSRDLTLKKVADGKWMVRTSLSTKKFPNGQHSLGLLIIDNSLNQAKEIGSASISITIAN